MKPGVFITVYHIIRVEDISQSQVSVQICIFLIPMLSPMAQRVISRLWWPSPEDSSIHHGINKVEFFLILYHGNFEKQMGHPLSGCKHLTLVLSLNCSIFSLICSLQDFFCWENYLLNRDFTRGSKLIK